MSDEDINLVLILFKRVLEIVDQMEQGRKLTPVPAPKHQKNQKNQPTICMASHSAFSAGLSSPSISIVTSYLMRN